MVGWGWGVGLGLWERVKMRKTHGRVLETTAPCQVAGSSRLARQQHPDCMLQQDPAGKEEEGRGERCIAQRLRSPCAHRGGLAGGAVGAGARTQGRSAHRRGGTGRRTVGAAGTGAHTQRAPTKTLGQEH
jgi:hypothetical protein